MKADLKINLKTSSPEQAQRILNELCKKLMEDGVLCNYSFEIQTDAGIITDKCILSQGNVIA